MIINGFKIHPELLEEVEAERCVLHECLGACCTGGAWLDVEQLKIIVPHVEAIKANLPEDRRDPNAWFSAPAADEDSPEGAIIGTNVVDDPRRPGETCCVFLRPDRLVRAASDFATTGSGVSRPQAVVLRVVSAARSRLAKSIIDHETEQDFGGATCRRACATQQPLYQVFQAELELILGEEGYRSWN